MNSKMTIFACFLLLCAIRISANDRLAASPLDALDLAALPTFACEAPEQSLFKNWAAYVRGEVPIRKSMSLNYGMSYDPDNDVDMLLTSFQWTCKYEDFWVHDAPEALMFKVELAAGSRLKRRYRGVVSCGVFAQWYLRGWANDQFQPYVDAGVGIIYTDFQNEEQGLRVNFNPRLGLGTDFRLGDSLYFAAIRFFHVSNADLHEDNRGINGTMLVFGRYF